MRIPRSCDRKLFGTTRITTVFEVRIHEATMSRFFGSHRGFRDVGNWPMYGCSPHAVRDEQCGISDYINPSYNSFIDRSLAYSCARNIALR